MGTGKDERTGHSVPRSIVKSAGEAEARGFVEAELPDEPVHPTMEMDRVQVVDPRHSPTLPRIDLRKVSGPRAPEQLTKPEAAGVVHAPLERPATKMQPIRIDPEMLMQLSRQAAEKAARPSTPGAPPPEVRELPAAQAREREDAEDATEDRITLPMRPKATPAPAVKTVGVASPWTTETAAVKIAASELPSALGPSTRSEPAPASEKPASAAPQGGRALRVMVPLAIVAVLGFTVFQVIPKGTQPEEVGALPVASGLAIVATTVPPAAESSGAVVVAAPTALTPPPLGTAEIDAGASVAPSAPVGPAPSKPKARNDDPYDAAAPMPAKTIEPVAPATAPTVAPTVPVPAVKPTATPSAAPASSSPQRMFGSEP
jgi:hypothetical protein